MEDNPMSDKEKRQAKIITNINYLRAIAEVKEFIENKLVYYVECFPERDGVYGFIVYY